MARSSVRMLEVVHYHKHVKWLWLDQPVAEPNYSKKSIGHYLK